MNMFNSIISGIIIGAVLANAVPASSHTSNSATVLQKRNTLVEVTRKAPFTYQKNKYGVEANVIAVKLHKRTFYFCKADDMKAWIMNIDAERYNQISAIYTLFAKSCE